MPKRNFSREVLRVEENTPSVTFATNCWEKDWDILLKTNLLRNKIIRNNYQFGEKLLIINNVRKQNAIEDFAKKAVNQGTLTNYYFVDDYIEDALNFFHLTKETLGRSYYYSNHVLVSIYLCKTDYLLYNTSDTWLEKTTPWVDPAIVELEKNLSYKVANPVWNKRFIEAKKDAFFEIENFWVGYGFSDQCFLIRTSDFKKPIYSETNPASARYPQYGGETFEKRVDSWMRNHKYLRLTYMHGYYRHQDFPKSKIKKKLSIAAGKYNW